MASEPDPLGVNNRTSAPIEPPDTSGSVPDFILPSRIVDPSNMANGCQWGGLQISCGSVSMLAEELARSGRRLEFTFGNSWSLGYSTSRNRNGFWISTYSKSDVWSDDRKTITDPGAWEKTGTYFQDVPDGLDINNLGEGGGYLEIMKRSVKLSVCRTIYPLGTFRPIFTGIERLLGQDILLDGVKAQANFLGYSAALGQTRDGDVIFSPGGSFIDVPKNFFVNIPSSIAKGTKILPSFSFTGQKIFQRGNLESADRLNISTQESVSVGLGYKGYVGLDISNPLNRGNTGRTATLDVGVGGGINAGGVSYGIRLFGGCPLW